MKPGRGVLLAALAAVGALAIGIGVGRFLLPAETADPTGSTSEDAERKILYWVAPMDPNYRRDKPGKSPMGMALVPVYAKDEEETEDEAVVRISPAVVQNLGLRSAPAQRGVLQRRIEAVGYVQYDEDAMRHIHTRVEGWIESLGVQAAGDPVAKGQILFEIYAPALVNAQREYLAAAERGGGALLAASRERLMALGMAAAEIDAIAEAGEPRQRVRTYAAADGVVTHLGVREGIYVTPATHVLSTADLNRLWVLAEVLDRQAAWVVPGQRAEVALPHLPGETWQGSVDYVYPALDAATRALQVRIGFANTGRALRPNMFARVTLFADDTGPVVHIPRQALIRGGDFDRVALDLGDGRYRSVRVVPGIEAGDRIEVREGLEAGQRVVTSGQFLIDSESNLQAAFGRSGGAEPTAPATPEQ